MPAFDSTFKYFNMQDELVILTRKSEMANTSANTFVSKVRSAFASAFAFQPVFA